MLRGHFSNRLKLNRDKLLSNLAFNFNLRPSTQLARNLMAPASQGKPIMEFDFNKAIEELGRGVIENKHSTDVESPPPPPRLPPRVCIDIHAGGELCSDFGRVLVFIQSPPPSPPPPAPPAPPAPSPPPPPLQSI